MLNMKGMNPSTGATIEEKVLTPEVFIDMADSFTQISSFRICLSYDN